MKLIYAFSRRSPYSAMSALTTTLTAMLLTLAGCEHPGAGHAKSTSAATAITSANKAPAPPVASTDKPAKTARRFTYTPRPYPVDERGFSPVDKALEKAY